MGVRRNFGKLRQLPSGRWQASYIGPDKQRYKATATFTDESEGDRWLDSQRQLIDLGKWEPPTVAAAAPEAPTLGEYATNWIAQRDLKFRTRLEYESMLKHHIMPTALGDTPLNKIEPETVRAWYAKLCRDPDRPTRRARVYGMLHAILNTVAEDGKYLTSNPCKIRGAMKVVRQRQIIVIGADEIAELAARMSEQLRAAVLVKAWGAMRWGEIAELRRKDIDLDEGLVRIRRAVVYREKQFVVGTPKGKGPRDVWMPPHIHSVLSIHLSDRVGPGPESLLFPSPDTGGHMTDYVFRREFKPAAAAMGRPAMCPHDLRHSGAVLAALSGATIKELMDRVGHTTPAMSMHYQHTAEGRGKALAAQMSKLANGLQEGAA